VVELVVELFQHLRSEVVNLEDQAVVLGVMVVLLSELEFQDKVIREVVVLPVARDQLTMVQVVVVVPARLVQPDQEHTEVAVA
jgi:hypothetical protein